MGTVVEITLVARDDARARARLERAFAEIDRLEAILTRYDPSSDLSRLNRAAGGGPEPVDPALFEVLRRAVDGARRTRGAFDPSVGPLVALWIDAAARDRAPDEAEIAAARARVGAERIRFLEDGRVALPTPGMSLDLGGIGKGFALDRVRAQLEADGVSAALLSFGQSSAIALGAPPDADGWNLALRGASGDVEGQVTLRDQAFSVSSTLGQWSEIGGRRYGHVVDPRTGRALERAAQAAVVAPDATSAEILSTALVVLEPGAGLAVAASWPGVEARILDDRGGEWETPGWRDATRFAPWRPADAADRGASPATAP